MAVAGAILLLPTISGCATTESGFANSQTSSNVSLGETQTTVSSSAKPSSSSIDPCELVSAEDLADVGEFETEYQEGGGSRYCVWQEGFESGGNGFSFSVGVRDSQGIDAVRDIGGGVDPTEVNQRPAVKTEDPVSGDCMLAVKVSDSSRIDVTVLGEDGDGDSCGLAEVIAGMVEPRLPELP
ncbi:DUF3558 family protein [Saccharomonospora glauca]|nr:DUF3558 family protein [Saccharomonospora glauca]